MIISSIVAVSENNIIGKDNQLIWRLPDDMKYFREKTEGHCVVTGRKNYESIPEKFRPLVGRTNIVVTRQNDYFAPGAIVVNSIEGAVEKAKKLGETELFIIGGAEIYKQTLHLIDRLYLTRVHGQFEGDATFPAIEKTHWVEQSAEFHPADEKHKFGFTFYSLAPVS